MGLLLCCLLGWSLGRAEDHGGSAVELRGQLLEPEDMLRDALGLRVPGLPSASETQQILRYLEILGYRARSELKAGRLIITISPYRVIRKIYIKGNWPIFEEEILRQLRFRPGQRLPEGQALKLAIERQEERLKTFLNREGYFEGHLVIWVEPTSEPHEVDLHVHVIKGRRYKVGEVRVAPVSTTMGLHRDRDGAGEGERSGRQDPEGRTRIGRRDGTDSPGRTSAERSANLAIPPSSIVERFQQKLWFYKRAFNTERFKDDVKELLESFHAKGYPGVRIRESFQVDRDRPASEAVRIALRIQQRKQIDVRYQGIERVKKDDLDKVLTLFKEAAYDDYEVGQSARQIQRLYQSKGFLEARVHFSRRVERDRDVVTFFVVEGPRYRIREVLFYGNKTLKDEDLRKVIKTRPFPCLGYIGLGEGGYITTVQLKQDAERLAEHYRDQGFPEVQVEGEMAPDRAFLGHPGALAATIHLKRPATTDLYVRFTIREGERLKVENVQIVGNKALSSALLARQLQLKPGQPFTEKALVLDKARIVRIYSEHGRPYAAVSSLEEIDEQGTQVAVQLTVQEGKDVRFGPVFVRGNFKTRRSVIEQDLEFEVGDPFDIRKIEEAEQRLRKREIFNVVRVQPLGLSDRRTRVPVLVQVEERYDDWGSLEFSVGASTDNKLFGAVAYNHHNLFGFGTMLSLKAEYGMEIWGGRIQYRDPRLLGSAFVLDVQALARSQETERLGEILTFGGSLSVSREILTGLTGLVRYEIRQVKHREGIVRPAGVDEYSQVDVLTRVAGLGPALVFDRRDNPLSPTRGYRVEGSMLWASEWLGGSDHFIKVNLNGQAFIPLPLSMSIAVNLRYDQGIPLGGSSLLPKVERYYAGGDTTIRGLEEDMALAERIAIPLAPSGGATLYQIRPQGGNIRLLGNIEFQFPIWPESIVFGWPLMGGLFLDNGVITNSFDGFDWSTFRHGAGAALRLMTPVGSTSIAYAFVLDPEVGDPTTGRLHFNFGYIF